MRKLPAVPLKTCMERYRGIDFMIDMHIHIVPGIDDGARTAEEARRMLLQAADGGTTGMIVTPHCNIEGYFENFESPELETAFQNFFELAQKTVPDMKIGFGQEVYGTIEAPELISDVGAQVRDITIRRTAGVRSGITLKKAWELMQTERVVTLPIVNEERKLVGLISNNDIAMSYMEVSNQESLSQARPRYRNIIETLNGTLLTGNEHGIFMHGKVEVAAGNKDRIDEYLDRDDLVILADREEIQRRALELDVSCMVICSGSQVSTEILEMAKRRDCVLISTPYDAYTTARLINQSMPIKSIMTKDGLVTFELDDYVDDIREVMSKERHRDFPVLDENGDYVGMISRRNLLNMQK